MLQKMALSLLVAATAAELNAETSRRLFVLNTDGTGFQPLSLPRDLQYGSPSWSHDGQWIAFDAWKNSATFAESHIYVARLDGKQLRDLGPGAMPHWSPDDQQILASIYQPIGLFVINPDGSSRERLLDSGSCARWSPAGDRFAYFDWTPRYHVRLFDVLTSETERLTTDDWHPRKCPTWSPDGQQLCFVSGTRDEQAGRHLVIVPLRDGQPRSPVKGKTRYYGKGIDLDVAWSPDGRYLLCSLRKETDDNWQLHLLRADQKGPPVAVIGQPLNRHNVDPCWSPDGKQILFVAQSPR